MPRFFRKIRIDAVRMQKVKKYFLYAVGEILLVTIGILIAVKINNINQNKQQEQELQAIYKAVHDDLVIDSVFLHQVIERNSMMDSIIQKIIKSEEPLVSIDTINELNARGCAVCRPYHLTYAPFTPNQKGYEALKQFDNNIADPQDSLTFKIIELYSQKVGMMTDLGKKVGDHVMESLIELENKNWYLSFLTGKFSKESIDYFVNDPRYKNRLATYTLLNSNNYLSIVKEYHLQSREIVEEIERRK